MSENDVTPESKPRRRAAGRPAGPPVDAPTEKADKAEKPAAKKTTAKKAPVAVPVFQAAPLESMPNKKKPAAKKSAASDKPAAKKAAAKKSAAAEEAPTSDPDSGESGEERTGGNNRNRNRNRRGGKNKNRAKNSETGEATESDDTSTEDSVDESTESAEASAARKRSRKRTRDTADGESGSTRLDAKRNRRRDGRDAGRRRTPILSESEFLARRENVERVMVVRQQGIRTQIAVLEDGVVVEHYINQSSSGSLVGNVYLGRVQNVLPGMEAAFVDIGKGRNAVLYAGEVNWDAAGLDGQPKKIETALKSGDPILVQVTKDPVGQKGARLTSQISLPGRFLVYVPNNPMTGISRKLPDRERSRLKTILKAVVPEDGGVIVRTAAEGASEEELGRDVARLAAQWTDIEAKSKTASPPTMLYGEPDISIKVVRDIFNEDVKKLVVSGAEAWETVEQYVSYVAPDLADRLEKYVGTGDVFTEYRVDEQIAKALDRKVYLPSGGSLVIDRTEAMTVVDVNTGKFIGQGGNLEQTVTKNNLEAAEEIVRQLRLRDIGGIIVIDFIDMVLESNRDQVIRRLIECLGRDRTKHQVAEVTSLGLVQMTRKRIGAGLLEVFSDSCDHCQGRGAVINMDGHDAPKPPKNKGKKGNHDHSGDESTDSEPESADSV
ncbi:MAG: Rne/Rng family ribonuclease [Actinomycetes bacterium]